MWWFERWDGVSSKHIIQLSAKGGKEDERDWFPEAHRTAVVLPEQLVPRATNNEMTRVAGLVRQCPTTPTP
jgi:hypothetical protein